jgi:hypothetical protein
MLPWKSLAESPPRYRCFLGGIATAFASECVMLVQIAKETLTAKRTEANNAKKRVRIAREFSPCCCMRCFDCRVFLIVQGIGEDDE